MKLGTSKKFPCTSNTNQLKIGDMVIEVEYGKNNKTMEECLLTILKHKLNNA